MLVLETPRLLIRPLIMPDLDEVHRLHTDPFIVQSLFSGEPPSRESTREKMELYVREWEQNGFGFFGVFLKESSGGSSGPNEFVGRAGLRYFEDSTDIEYGHLVFGHMAGRGIGPELARAILRFAFEERKVDRIVALIRPDNERAIRAAQKVGFTHVEDRQYGDRMKGFYEVRADRYGESEAGKHEV